VKRVLRGVSREFGEGASLDELETALRPALGGESLQTDDFASDEIEQQSERFARARGLFRPSEDGDSLWERFSQRATEMQRLYHSADIMGRCKRSSAGTRCLMLIGFEQRSTRPTLTDELSSVSSMNASRGTADGQGARERGFQSRDVALRPRWKQQGNRRPRCRRIRRCNHRQPPRSL